MNNPIQLVSAEKIDAEKWDRCIAENANGLIYSTTTYLNTMAANWHGLVMDDYAMVMAVPWKKKMGIRYGYMPAFTQQLGLVGNCENIDPAGLLKKVAHFLPYGDYHFNFLNGGLLIKLPAKKRTNLVIDLSKDFLVTSSLFKKDLKQDISKAEKWQLQYAATEIDEAVNCFRENYSHKIQHLTNNDFLKFATLCKQFETRGQCFVRSVIDTNGCRLATAIFLKDNKRIYNLMNTSLAEGRKKSANHFLLSNLIAEFSGQPLLLDFEGSELPGVKSFYESFGAVDEPYFYHHYNTLPWPLNILKA